MRQKLFLSTLMVFLLLSIMGLKAQQTISPDRVAVPIAFDVFDLSKAPMLEPGIIDRSWQERVIPNKEGFLEEFNVPSTWTGPDPVLQDFNMADRTTATIAKNFAGMSNTSGVAPPDTQGDVSPSYYMQMVNLSFQIFDKNGSSLYGPALSSTLWQGFTGPWSGTNDGDPIVLYDQYADRWIATQFALPNYPSGPFYELIAVSVTNDPRGTWYRYAYTFSDMPDYPKFGVWPDGYYMTINRFAPPSLVFAGGGVCIFNRSAMLEGAVTPAMVSFNLSTSYGSLLPADVDGPLAPPAGSPNYLLSLGTNSLRMWQAHVDWTNTGSSTLTQNPAIATSSFSYSGITINQPGTSQTLDPLASRLMYRLQYRKFAEYEVMVTNHTVNANGAGQAGVRWYELRKYPGQSWNVYQQGTYAPNDGIDRWMASAAMNGNGDIAIGYSASSSSTYPSIRFTGRTAAAPAGQMDVTETIIQTGAASQTGVNRWGDYSMMSIDPVNDNTFWYSTEYSNGGWNWKTRIASVNFGTPPAPQAPVANFTASSTTVSTGGTVSFTDLSTNTPTSWSWVISGPVTINSSLQNPSITFSTAGVYSVTLTATNGTGSGTKTINNYITVNTVTAPVSAFTPTQATVNAGQSVSFTDQSTNATSWAWTFSGGTPSSSTQQNPVVQYNVPGTYQVSLVAANNGVTGNTATGSVTVNSVSYCTSTSTNPAHSDYISQVSFNGTPYSNGVAANYTLFTNGPNLSPGNTCNYILTPNSTSRKESWRIWIDYNGNGLFTDPGELVVTVNNARKVVTGSFVVQSGISGTSRMRVSMKYGGGPTACETFTNGEVEDYPVTFNTVAAPISNSREESVLKLELYPNPTNGILNIKVSGESGKVVLRLYSAIGIILRDSELTSSQTTIDVSALAKGLYYIGIEDEYNSSLKKFIKE